MSSDTAGGTEFNSGDLKVWVDSFFGISSKVESLLCPTPLVCLISDLSQSTQLDAGSFREELSPSSEVSSLTPQPWDV